MAETVRSGPTLSVVARIAGVSVPTVSKVLNGRTEIAPATRQRVTEALRQVGYQRAPSTPSEQRGSRRLVDVILHGLRTTYASDLLAGIEAAAHAEGLDIVVAASDVDRHHREAPGPGWLDHLIDRGTGGVLLVLVETTTAQHDWLTYFEIPSVIVDPITTPPAGVPSVAASNQSGAAAATGHLIELGHRRIAHISGNPGKLCTQARLRGFAAAMTAAGLPMPPEYVRVGNFHASAAHGCMEQLLDLDERPTAVFVASDGMAVGAYQAIRERGLEPGRDISVVGFDDVAEATIVSPMLTTVRQPLGEMGATGLRLLTARMRGENVPDHVELPTELIVRGSATRRVAV